MAVRVKVIIRDKFSGREVVANALANSGFEATTRKILIPKKVAEILGLWPLPEDAEVVSFDSVGGEVGLYLIRNRALLRIYGEESDFVECDVLISTIEKEVLLSDKVISALEIVLEDPGAGLWRLRRDPPNKLRRTEEKQLW